MVAAYCAVTGIMTELEDGVVEPWWRRAGPQSSNCLGALGPGWCGWWALPGGLAEGHWETDVDEGPWRD